MKRIIILKIFMAFTYFAIAQETIIFQEGFEGGSRPTGWIEEKVLGLGGSPTGPTVSWQYLDGGYFDYPDHAYQGNYNAMFQLESYLGETTILITPELDLSDITKPELRFSHVQKTWFFSGQEYNDMLNVYYKRGNDSAWVLLEAYEDPVEDWVLRSILLPDSSLSSTYYIGFEGITGFGYGTCIDTVHLMETGIISKFLDSYSIQQASTDIIPTNTTNNPILKIIFNVQGNDGNLYLDSLKVKSLNTDDTDLMNNGVKLYITDDSTFKNPILLSSGVNFVNGIASFENINYDLPRGITSAWITYDVGPAANHDVHNNVLDAKIEAERIYISGTGFPFSDKSPAGERLLKESIFKDGFETDLSWIYNGSFERAIPLGLGGSYPGNPDPENAYNGSYAIGTDLTADGVYANDLTDRQDSAVSPIIDCFYYKDVNLYYARWLNIEAFDVCYIDISNDNRSTWNNLWFNGGAIIDNTWSVASYDLNDADFQKDVSIRFSLGFTSPANQYTGWNIDDFILVGDFISKDVGITGFTLPITGCGHTTSDDISVYIENYGGEATPNSIPLRYSVDGGSYVTDAYSSSIAIADSALFTFSVGADLSSPGYHTINVETILSGDEISNNNSKSITIYSFPTLTLPYSENFESNDGYYLPEGLNSTWEYGVPDAIIIDTAASGTNAWVTNLLNLHNNNDSSYLESPCFDFSGSDSIVFEFKCIGLSEDQTDGLNLLYSLDQGSSWNLVPDDNDFYWNWYNETYISELELPGIDTTNGEWLTFRQLLPSVLSNQSSVKFRFAFESNGSVRYEGFGIDDVKIYKAPYDVGITSLDYPYTRCEWNDTTHVKVYVENYGLTDVIAGTKIPLSLDFESQIIKDTLTLASNLAPEDSVLFTFNSTVDMSYAGDYDFIINTRLESNQYFYNDTLSNDTLYSTVSVTGMPRYNPFPDQIGDNPVDTFLVAGSGYSAYNWSGGGTADVAPNDSLFVTSEAWYKVTVTNGVGCTAIDSVEVVNSAIDMAMDTLFTELVDSCHRNSLTELSVRIKNKSLDSLFIGDTVYLAYQINEMPIVPDTLFLSDTLTPAAPGDTVRFTFAEKADLTAPGPYSVKVFTDFLRDLNHADDTVTKTVNTFGYVDVELAYDTIYSSEADTLEIIATPGYSTYNWSPAGSNDTISPINNVSQWYVVTVTDSYACNSDSDSTFIETLDFGITSIVNPLSDCEFTTTEPIQISVHNYSGNTYTTGTKVPFKYNFNNVGWVNDTATLATDFSPNTDKTLTITNTIDPSALGEYDLDIRVIANQDADTTNDLYNHSFETWGYPDVNLVYDTVYTTKPDTLLLIAQEGFASYNWSDGSTNDTLSVTKNYSQHYIVTVTDVNGCGSDRDSTQIITYDLGIIELVYPLSACVHSNSENVIVSVKNFGYDTLKAGMVIPVGYYLEGVGTFNENFTLTSDMNPLKTANYTFTNKADLSATDTYRFKLFTDFGLDVSSTNDTLVDVIKTFGYPSIELGNDIYTSQPDSVILVAAPGFKGYFWDEGTKNDSLVITYPASREYSIIVNDINGCTAEDTINVYTYNILADSINAPVSQCELTSSETVTIGVKNNGADTLQIGEPLEVGYRLNSGSYVSEAFTLTEILYPDSTSLFTLSGNPADLSANQLHQFKLFAKLTNIDVETSDTTTKSVDYLKPSFDLGSNVIAGGSQHLIDAGSGYTNYLWFNSSTSQTYTVDINAQSPNRYYAVTVTNSDACTASDSIQVTFTTQADLEVISMPSPSSSVCWYDTTNYLVDITIRNAGVVNLTAGTSFDVGYTIDNGTPVTETINLSSALNAGGTRDHSFTPINFSEPKIYQFKSFVNLAGDGVSNNDTLAKNVDISGPIVSLGPDDTIYFTTPTYQIAVEGTYDAYAWSTGATTKTITISETGTYYVTVTDGGCQGFGHIYCEKPTSTDNFISGDGYSILYFPNPVAERLSVQFDNRKSTDTDIEIFNTNGQILYRKELINIRNSIEKIDVSSYSNGLYYIRFKIKDKYYIRKLIIQ